MPVVQSRIAQQATAEQQSAALHCSGVELLVGLGVVNKNGGGGELCPKGIAVLEHHADEGG